MLAYLMFWRQIIVLAASLQCNFEVGQHRCVGVLEDTFDYIYICKLVCILHYFSPIKTKKTDQTFSFSLLYFFYNTALILRIAAAVRHIGRSEASGHRRY